MTAKTDTGLPADTWDRAYADVLFRHIDRLNDVCDEDPLERIAQDLRDAFERVAAVHPVMSRNEVWHTKRTGEPWPLVGATVWYPEGALHSRPMKEARVMLTFRGEDNRIWCLLQVGKDYTTRPAMGLSDTPDGPTNLELSMRQPEVARKFLLQAGIIDETGQLAPRFRPPAEGDAQ